MRTKYNELFDYLEDHHGLILIDSEKDDLIDLINKSNNSQPSEAVAVRQNEQQQEHCKKPEGKDSCNYKDKDLFACLALRKCPFCDAS